MLIASVTASITTTLTVRELSGKVRSLHDLSRVWVGAVGQSHAFHFLEQGGMTVRPFGDERVGLQALVDETIDAFVSDKSLVTYLARTAFPGRAQVLAEIFDPYYLSMALPSGSPRREALNRAVLHVMASDAWLRLKQRYLGLSH